MDPLIWVIDDDSSIRFVFDKSLTNNKINHRIFEDGNAALEALNTKIPDVIVSDIKMPGIDGLSLINEVHKKDPNIPFIIMTAHSDLSAAVDSYEHGTFEYLPKPFDVEDALNVIRRAAAHRMNLLRKKDETVVPTARVDDKDVEIIGKSPAMQEVFKSIGRAAKNDLNVIIEGESGTGRELVALALHNHSLRGQNGGKFITLNVTATPKDNICLELFGTDENSPCALQRANGGTLFINEFDELPKDAQVRLSHVLNTGEYIPLNQTTPVKTDVRFMVSTTSNTEKLTQEGKCLDNLLFKLNLVSIKMPALRERNNDIPMLATHFLSKCAQENNQEPKKLTSEVLVFLCRQPWPGNVRQLKNLCKYLTLMVTGRDIQMSDLPSEYLQARNQQAKITTSISGTTKEPTSWQEQLRNWVDGRLRAGEHDILSEAVPEFERVMLEAALSFTSNHKQESAKLLGWGRNTLTRKLKELNIQN